MRNCIIKETNNNEQGGQLQDEEHAGARQLKCSLRNHIVTRNTRSLWNTCISIYFYMLSQQQQYYYYYCMFDHGFDWA